MQSSPMNKDSSERLKNNIEMSHESELACCAALDPTTGDICGEQTGLQILNEFREFYEERIRRIDINSDNGIQEKMKIMMEWIKDLDAQNTMLVCTVEELEEAACGRVKMLEEKLKHTSSALTDNMPQYIKPSETILNDVHKRINQLEAEEETLKLKVVNLQSDIRGLLELIRRANMENCWRLDGIKFYEINQRDIPIPDESSYGQAMGDCNNIDIMTQQLQLLSEKEKNSIKYQHELQDKVAYLNEKLQDREEKIQKLMSKFEDFKDSFKRQTETNADMKCDTMQIIHLLDMEENDLVTVENSSEDIHERIINKDDAQVYQRFQNELEEKTREIMRLTHQLNKLDKESLESREALAIEVAGKHDTVMNLKQQVNKLEENGRQLQMQLHFKEDIIKNMRTEMKLLKTKIGTTALKSPKKSHINASPTSQRVTWSDNTSNETLGEMKTKNNNLLTTLLELKTILISEHGVLKEKIQELHNILYHTTLMEKAASDKYSATGHSMVDDMLAMMEKYRDKVDENESSTTNAAFNCNDKLMKVIDTLSDLCMNKYKRILDLEYVIEDARKRNEQISQSSECKHNICDIPEITRQQFNEMEEFRVCTVEAQAATEDLREEIDVVTCNLNCRNQLFNDLCNSIEKICDIIARTKQNISAVINSVKAHIEEKILANKTIKLGHDKLKDIKNEINEARLKDNCREHEFDIYNRSYDNIMDEVEYIVCNLDVFISKEDYSITLLEELRDHVNSVEDNFEEMQRNADHVLQENKIAQKVIEEKTKKLDKLEQELDYAHTRMQETLENIVFINQQNESSNGHSCSTTDDASSIHKSDEHSQLSPAEIAQLKNSLCSKDKLLEHKDEVIRIQKDSIEMTQEEYKDLRQRLQSKIDAQVDIINQCIQEKMKLLEQNQLQNQTIKHLQDAVVDAKRNLNRQLPQKSTMDFGDGWNPITPPVFNNGNVHDV
ncbi:hypothetical protein PV327_005480 [Microctonus hyperodae]|uniref:Uncharacterized protein n=1 Tax=Microctonus hyperodae TaxID=165561 RepID=A0AA39G1F4_MICHY|nr:hypothetical protein PV327_005480 [Microctonus hyperodae]